MYRTINAFRTLLLGGATAIAIGGTAFAVPVGAFTASVAVDFSPTVGAGVIGFSGPLFITASTGEFNTQPVGPAGLASGTINFSMTIGSTVADVLPGLLTFTDNHSGSYVFDAISALTTGYTNNPGVSSTIALYILGDTSDAGLGETDTPSSMTLTLNSTGSSSYSASFTLSNPPAPPPSVPEPMSMALLGAGIAGISAVRRRRANV